MFVLAALLLIGVLPSRTSRSTRSRRRDLPRHWGASNLILGLTLGLALLLIGIGAIQWARKLMGDHEIVEYRHSAASSAEDREEALAAFYRAPRSPASPAAR